jgi:hypothetical protein
MPVLQIVFPLTFVARSIHVDVNSEAIRLVVHPIALVDISIDVNKLALAVGPVVLPKALIACSIRPDLFAIAVSETSDPLAKVSRSSFEGVHLAILPLGVGVVDRLRYGLALFVNCEVATVSSL